MEMKIRRRTNILIPLGKPETTLMTAGGGAKTRFHSVSAQDTVKALHSYISTIVGRQILMLTQNVCLIKTFSLPIDRADSF